MPERLLIQNGMVWSPGAPAAEPAEVLIEGERSTAVGPGLAALRRMAQAAAEGCRGRNRVEWDFASRLAPVVGQVCRALSREPYPINRYASSDWGPLERGGRGSGARGQ